MNNNNDYRLFVFPFKGVPKSKRGEIWRFLAKQHKFQSPPGDQPWNEKSYEEIKEGLSTHQHSIFIDLGKCSIFLLRYSQNKNESEMLLLLSISSSLLLLLLLLLMVMMMT